MNKLSASASWLSQIDIIATDVDGTLTNEHGHFPPELITAFEQCESVGIKVLLVTGRPASWVQGMVEYLPVAGGIGENGGIYCPKKKEEAMRFLLKSDTELPEVSIEEIEAGRLQRIGVFELLKKDYPHLRPTGDCVTRLTDFTFPLENLSGEDLQKIALLCEGASFGFTYSSIHGHIKDPHQHKASGILKAARLVPELQTMPERIVTVGDSRNDQEMFDAALFPHSVGVANIERHLPSMHIHPQYCTSAPGAAGFAELVSFLIASRS